MHAALARDAFTAPSPAPRLRAQLVDREGLEAHVEWEIRRAAAGRSEGLAVVVARFEDLLGDEDAFERITRFFVATSRDGDVVARAGDETFALLLPDTCLLEAEFIKRDLFAALQATPGLKPSLQLQVLAWPWDAGTARGFLAHV